MAAAPKIPGGTELKITSSDGSITLKFRVSKSPDFSDIKRQMVAQLMSVLPKGKTLVDKSVDDLAKDLKANKVGVEDLVERLTGILDNLKDRTVPVKKAEGAAPAPAAKKGEYSEWTKDVLAGLTKGEFDSVIAGEVWRNSTKNYEDSKREAIRLMKEAAPAKKAAANAKVTEAQRAAAAAKAEREAAAAAKKEAEVDAAVAKKLGVKSAGPAGVNQGWIDTVEVERDICKSKCDTIAEQKLREGRPTRKVKTAGPPENVAAEYNTGVKLSEEEAWNMFTSGLPKDVVAYVNTPITKGQILNSSPYKTWIRVYAGSKKLGKKDLAEYQEKVKSSIGSIIAKSKATMAVVTGASRKRRASGGSRKNRSRKNRSRKNRRN